MNKNFKCGITPQNITELKDNEIFVFGSNEAGIHKAGAAKTALDKFGAIYEKGFGIQGDSFALPTKDFNVQTLPLSAIQKHINSFKEIILLKENKDKKFLITEIGCGLAGYTVNEIAPLFRGFEYLSNVHLPQSFIDWLSLPYIIETYKMTDENMKCRDFQYELNKKYTCKEVLICNVGFHSCNIPQNCLEYYKNNGKNRLFLCEIEINGNESFENDQNLLYFNKIATDNIIFIREIIDLSKAFNFGDRNSGNWNSGDMNSGDRNSGYRNSGNRNSGNWNSGDRNSGYLNTITQPLYIFNKITNEVKSDIYFPNWMYFDLISWKNELEMTNQDKID